MPVPHQTRDRLGAMPAPAGRRRHGPDGPIWLQVRLFLAEPAPKCC